jgi:hypothetical protein
MTDPRDKAEQHDDCKSTSSKNRHVISDEQLKELQRCLDEIDIYPVNLWPVRRSRKRSRLIKHAPLRAIYMFYRQHIEPVRVYIGQSSSGSDRINGQIKRRKWATDVISIEMRGCLDRATLRLLEACILRTGFQTFPGALWHNQQGLSVCSSDTLSAMSQYPVLNKMTLKILDIFGDALPHTAFHPLSEYPITHVLGGPTEEYYGLLSHRGRCVFLLKGSRMSSRATNMTMLWRMDGTGLKYGSLFEHEGKLERMRGTPNRPAGLTITEPVKFRDKEEAARFLTLDGPSLIWERA